MELGPSGGVGLVRTEHRDRPRMVKNAWHFFEAAMFLTAGAQSMCRLMVGEKAKWGDWVKATWVSMALLKADSIFFHRINLSSTS